MTGSPIGYMPSPYGKNVPVFRSGSDPEDFVFNIDGCLDMAGIYNSDTRNRCKTALETAYDRGGDAYKVYLAHGGGPVPRISLPKPREPVYPTLPRDMDMDIPIENWVTLALEQPCWNLRAAALLDIVGSNLEQVKEWNAPPEILAISLSLLLTATLEHLGEPEIDCVEAAALYALTTHPEWSTAGVEWLEPYNATWFADWIAERRTYSEFARLCRNNNTALPAWLAGWA